MFEGDGDVFRNHRIGELLVPRGGRHLSEVCRRETDKDARGWSYSIKALRSMSTCHIVVVVGNYR